MSDDDLRVPVFSARNITEADLVRGLLDANGIRAEVEDDDSVTTLDGIVTGNRGVTVSVRREDAPTAREVIEEARALEVRVVERVLGPGGAAQEVAPPAAEQAPRPGGAREDRAQRTRQETGLRAQKLLQPEHGLAAQNGRRHPEGALQ